MAGVNDLERMAAEIAGLRDEVRQLRELLTAPSQVSYLTSREVAEMFRVSYETVRRRVSDGKWPAVIIGRQARFGPEEISAIRQALIKKVPEPQLSSLERRRRNNRIRSLLV